MSFCHSMVLTSYLLYLYLGCAALSNTELSMVRRRIHRAFLKKTIATVQMFYLWPCPFGSAAKKVLSVLAVSPFLSLATLTHTYT